MTRNIIAGSCTTCGRTGYWCRCGEYGVARAPMTAEEARSALIAAFGEAEAHRLLS